MINIDAETKQYLKELVASYEHTIIELQGRVQELETELTANNDPVLRDINLANQKLERELNEQHLVKHAQQLEVQNERLQSRVKSLEEELRVERRLKYYWAERPMDDDYRETQERIREMKRLYHNPASASKLEHHR